MEQKITVKGMHCDACKALIKMELEDAGFEEKIETIELGDNNTGYVVFKEISSDELEKAKSIINALENYSTL